MKTRIDELTQQVCNHLAGRPVVLRWRDPASKTAVGQAYKGPGNTAFIDVTDNLISIDAKLRVLLHELAHIRHDFDWMPETMAHKMAPGFIKRTDQARKTWRSHPREKAAQNQADQWLKFAADNVYQHERAGRSLVECKLLALLDWRP